MKDIVFISVLIALSLADFCGGNCLSGNCPSCPCGTAINVVDIGTWCSKYNWGPRCCNCIVSHESGGNVNAVNYDTNGLFYIGLWQVNSSTWGSCNSGRAPCDPAQNLNCAIKIYQANGNSWKGWSTHTACDC